MIADILNDSAKMLFVSLALALFADLILAAVFYVTGKQFVANSRTVLAKIDKLETRRNTTKAHVTFRDPLGKAIDATVIVAPNIYKEGQEIELLSHKENPSKVKANALRLYWLIPMALLSGAVVIGVVISVLVSQDIAKLPY